MSEKSRDQLKAEYRQAKKELAAIEDERKRLLEPTHDRWWAAVEKEGEALEALDSHITGTCEGCLEIIMEDEPDYFDGEYYHCLKCAPKAGDALNELLREGEAAHDWYENGKAGYDRAIAYLKSLPSEQSLAMQGPVRKTDPVQ